MKMDLPIRTICLVFLLILISSCFTADYVYGSTWEKINYREDLYFSDIFADSGNSFFLSGDDGLYYYSSDKLLKITSDPVFNLFKHSEHIYFSKMDGIYSYKYGNIEKISDEFVAGMTFYQDRLFYFNQKGLFFIKDEEHGMVENFKDSNIISIKNVDDRLFVFSLEFVKMFYQDSIINIDISSINQRLSDVFILKDKIYMIGNSSVYKLNDEYIPEKTDDFYFKLKDINGDNNRIYMLSANNIFYFNGSEVLNLFDPFDPGYDYNNLYSLDIKIFYDKRYLFILESDGNILKYSEFVDKEEDDFDSLLRKAQKYYFAGNIDKSFNEFSILLKKRPENSDVNLFLGRIYKERKEYYKSIEYLSKAYKYSDDFHVAVEIAGVETELENYDQAYIILSRAIQLYGDTLSYHVNIINNLMLQKDFIQADYYVEKAIKKFGNLRELIKNKVNILKYSYKEKEAEKLLKDMIFESQQDFYYLEEYLRMLLEQERYKEVFSYIELARERFSDKYEDVLLVLEITAYLENGNYVKAEKLINDAMLEFPYEINFPILYSYFYLKLSKYELSEKYLSSAERKGNVEKNWLYNYVKGYIYMKDNWLSKAIKSFEVSIENNKRFPYSRFYVAQLYIRFRQFYKASREFKLLLDYWPNFKYYDEVYKKYKSLE